VLSVAMPCCAPLEELIELVRENNTTEHLVGK
jgi:hypothetical protein